MDDKHSAPHDQLNRVVDEYLSRRDGTPREQLIAEHPELMPELEETLRRLELIERAKRALHSQHDANTIELIRLDDETSEVAVVRCPHCRNEAQVDLRISLRVVCGDCQHTFCLSSSSHSPPPKIKTLGHFELLECVGAGGFGTVWRAMDQQLDRIVAIKLPRDQPTGRARDDFINEARIAAKLKHRNIVNVYEIGTVDETMYIVSDFIDGMSLDLWSQHHPFTVTEATELVIKLCDAVQVAHSAGIVHRDLKPGNILMDTHGEPTITDFGLAKHVAPDVTMTLDGRILGTPAYMSPEQAAGQSARANQRSDVYSLGVILFELLTGERPFRGHAAMLIHQVVHDDPPSPRHLDATVAADLETIVLKCLEKDPDARFESAGELAAELRRFAGNEPIVARPISRLARFGRWCHRKPRIASALATIALLLLVLVAAGWWSYFDERYDAQQLRVALEQERVALEQEHYMRQAVLQTGDFELLSNAVERAALDERLLSICSRLRADGRLEELTELLRDRATAPDDFAAAQRALSDNPTIRDLQSWIEQHQTTSNLKFGNADIFAWFVLGSRGTQLARAPQDTAIGRNYAWRTYFHGGTRDYSNFDDYSENAPQGKRRLGTTYLSSGLFTEVTRRFVFTVATPIQQGEDFLGVIGVMVELQDLAE